MRSAIQTDIDRKHIQLLLWCYDETIPTVVLPVMVRLMARRLAQGP